MAEQQIPLFPLHTVLFPGGPLPLRIFEPRYLDMVSDCLKHDAGFGVCLIEQGREVGKAASPVLIGVMARITDWDQRQDGMLGITAVGEQRFRLKDIEVKKNQLTVAHIELLTENPVTGLPEKYQPLVEIVERLIAHAGQHYSYVPVDYEDASWLSYRLAELLPFEMQQKQFYLEMNDPLERLEHIYVMLEGMEVV